MTDQDHLTEENLVQYAPPSWEMLPDLGLYKDQVITYLEQKCRVLYPTEKNFITPAMINNYVKSGLVTRPTGKKYDRLQLAQLVMLCTLKQVVSMVDMKHLLTPGEQGFEHLYAKFCETQSKVYPTLLARMPEANALDYAVEATALVVLCRLKLDGNMLSRGDDLIFPD